ncbi:hypothetical protein OSB04_006175 [Centaurea solstitialis]|uniref:Uncharacterized protein n=1 Tax=Centaurea solstitialis TaxID=347529 RepID=A0AA38THF4_9ASTR|nr:hypothetical protein OSB04_006175 [Centaurea solstitialis]
MFLMLASTMTAPPSGQTAPSVVLPRRSVQVLGEPAVVAVACAAGGGGGVYVCNLFLFPRSGINFGPCLRDKIQSDNNNKKKQTDNLFLKSQQQKEQEEEEGSRNRIGKSASVLPVTVEKEISEETVFWLMDRFAPC